MVMMKARDRKHFIGLIPLLTFSCQWIGSSGSGPRTFCPLRALPPAWWSGSDEVIHAVSLQYSS